MDNKVSQGVMLVGMWQMVLGFIVGAPCLFLGFSWFMLDFIAAVTGGGGNLTGLGLIFGSIASLIGILFLGGLKSAVLVIKGNPEGRKQAILFLCYTSILLVIAGGFLLFSWLIPVNFKYWRIPVSLLNVISVFFLIQPRVKAQFTSTEGLTGREKRIFNLLIAAILVLGTAYAAMGNIAWNKKIAAEEKYREKMRK